MDHAGEIERLPLFRDSGQPPPPSLPPVKGFRDIRFEGDLWSADGRSHIGMVGGVYHWIRPYTAHAIVVGRLIVNPDLSSQGYANPSAHFRVTRLAGRKARIVIAGVGESPVKLTGSGAPVSHSIRFQGIGGVIPHLGRHQLAELLRTPIHDALVEAGLDDLAMAALAAAVAMVGFTYRDPEPDLAAKDDDMTKEE